MDIELCTKLYSVFGRYTNSSEITFVSNKSSVSIVGWSYSVGNENLVYPNARGHKRTGNNVSAILRTKARQPCAWPLCSDIYVLSDYCVRLSPATLIVIPSIVTRGRRAPPSVCRFDCASPPLPGFSGFARRSSGIYALGIERLGSVDGCSPTACVRHQGASEAFQTKPFCLCGGDGQRTKIRDDLICIHGAVFIDCLLSGCACDVTLASANSFWLVNLSVWSLQLKTGAQIHLNGVE